MAKGPRTKLKSTRSQAAVDAEAQADLRKGGGPMAMHSKHHTQEAEKAEVASYKLNRKKF